MSKFRGAGKWKNDGPARANTGSSIRGKISAPIIVDNDEFPIREPGTGIATPLGKDSIERQLPLRSSTGSAQTFQPNTVGSSGIGDSPRVSPPPPQPASELPPPPTNQFSPLRNSLASIPPGAGDGKPQRKKSSLGSVFKKLFGGKKRKDTSSSSTIAQVPGDSKAGQHRSDPTALNRPKAPSPSQKRTASLPINEFNRALRSHSIVVEDLPLESRTNRESKESIPADRQTRPRRATTPSRLWAPNKNLGSADWTGLSPRPTSTHGRASKLVGDAETDAAVGVAITSGSHPNRRSRSLGELRALGPGNITIRRRSDEIRYWRESYDPGLLSPMSSNKADAEEPIQLDPPEMPQEVPQSQPFNFGPMGEMAGMKITQAASLETRVQKLEERMVQMERAISQVHRRTTREPVIFQDPPKKNLRRERSVSTNQSRTEDPETTLPTQPRYRELQPPAEGPARSHTQSSSNGSSRPSTVSTQNSYHHSFDSFSQPLLTSDEQTPVNSTHAPRPFSTSTTIRAMRSSSPIMSKDVHLTGEHYTALTNLILAEQAARQNLEAMVQNLQRQLQDLRSGAGSFQTPDSDRTADPLKVRGGNEFSSFEQGDSSDDEGRYVHDEFQIPGEERGHFSDDIFGGANGVLVKSPPRTLSLSRITLGVQPGVNF